MDTSCFAEPPVIDRIVEHVDLFLCDLKHMDGERHERMTGAGNELILANIRRLAAAGTDIIIRLPVIPGYNDDERNIEATGRFVASLGGINRIDILPYNSGGRHKSARLVGEHELLEAVRPSDDRLGVVAEKLRGFGFTVRIGG